MKGASGKRGKGCARNKEKHTEAACGNDTESENNNKRRKKQGEPNNKGGDPKLARKRDDKLHPRARGLWKTAFPLYNKVELVFGPDRATGNNTEDVEDMVHNMNTEFIDQEPTIDAEYYSSSDTGSRPPLSKRRNVGTSSRGVTRNNDPVACAIASINGSLAKMSDVMVRSDNRDELLATRLKMLLSELSMLPGVSDDDAIDASRVLSRSPTELEIFFSCPNDEWKVRYVQRIIAQLRGSTRQD